MGIEETHGAEAVQNNEISDEDLGDIAGGNVFKKAKKALKKAKKKVNNAGNTIANGASNAGNTIANGASIAGNATVHGGSAGVTTVGNSISGAIKDAK